MQEDAAYARASLLEGSMSDANISHKFFLRSCFAFLVGAALVSTFASLAVIGGSVPGGGAGAGALSPGAGSAAYSSALSVAICAVAAMHYHEILKLRNRQSTVSVEMQVDALRHGDWVITMPLLVLKFYAVINVPFDEYDSIFPSADVAAVTSVLMIVLGAFVRLGLDELSGWQRMTRESLFVGLLAYALSCVCLVLLLVDISRAASKHGDRQILDSLLFVWLGYPLVAFFASMRRYRDDQATPYDLNLSLIKDIAYAALDIYAKGVFATYSASVVFGVEFFNNGR
jgi:hypothetical protein